MLTTGLLIPSGTILNFAIKKINCLFVKIWKGFIVSFLNMKRHHSCSFNFCYGWVLIKLIMIVLPSIVTTWQLTLVADSADVCRLVLLCTCLKIGTSSLFAFSHILMFLLFRRFLSYYRSLMVSGNFIHNFSILRGSELGILYLHFCFVEGSMWTLVYVRFSNLFLLLTKWRNDNLYMRTDC